MFLNNHGFPGFSTVPYEFFGRPGGVQHLTVIGAAKHSQKPGKTLSVLLIKGHDKQSDWQSKNYTVFATALVDFSHDL